MTLTKCRLAAALATLIWTGEALLGVSVTVRIGRGEDLSLVPDRRPTDAKVLESLPYARPTVTRPRRDADDVISRIDLGAVRRPDLEQLPDGETRAPVAVGRDVDVAVTWIPPNQRHLPVYFEDVAVERYGQTVCPLAQPVVSGGRFLVQAVLLPYQMGVDAPGELSYDVGLARPGSPTPSVRERWPLSARGALYQGAAATGVFYLLQP